jgi:hypothetical protein
MTATKRKKTAMQQRLVLLNDRLDRKTRKIRWINGRLVRFIPSGIRGVTAPDRRTKMLREIAGLRVRERAILSEIEDVERQHRLLRRSKALKRIVPSSSAVPAPVPFSNLMKPENDDEPEKPRNGLWFLLALLWMATPRR